MVSLRAVRNTAGILISVILVGLSLTNSLIGSPIDIAAPGCPMAKGHVAWMDFIASGTPCDAKVNPNQDLPYFTAIDVAMALIGVAIGGMVFMSRRRFGSSGAGKSRDARSLLRNDTKWESRMTSRYEKSGGDQMDVSVMTPPEPKTELDPDLLISDGFNPNEKVPRRKRDKQDGSADPAPSSSTFENPFDF